MKISEHFTLKELIFSDTAIREGIDNTPDVVQTDNLINLVLNVLEPARMALGVAILINSAFRSYFLNKHIGGSRTSDHTQGKAADLRLLNGDNASLFNWIKDNLSFDQLIWEFGDDNHPKWVHVSYRTKETNRNQVLRAIKENGKTKYISI